MIENKENNYDYFDITNINENDFPYHYINKNDYYVSGNRSYIDLSKYKKSYEIVSGGIYQITGIYKGKLIINSKGEMVHLILDNVDIESEEGPAIIIENASKVVITAFEGSSNKISDSGRYKESYEYESAIQSNADLTFNGKGSIDIYGLYKDAIRTNDTVKIVDGNLSIYSKRTGIHATDGLNIAGGKIYVASEKNGFKTSKNGNNNRGALIISGGEIEIIAGRYSFVSNAPLYICNSVIHEKSLSRYDVSDALYVNEDCFQ